MKKYRSAFAEGYPPRHHMFRDLQISMEINVDAPSIIKAPVIPAVRTDHGGVQVGIMAHRLKPKEAIKRVKEGGIAVVVLPKPNINWAKVVRISNPDKRFARTYLVITRDNVAEVEKELQ